MKKNTLFFASVLLTLITNLSFAQVGIGTTDPDSSAILDVDVSSLGSNEKLGFLPPRMNTSERDAINGGAPSEGLVIFNTDKGCIEIFNSKAWFNACEGTGEGVIPGNTTCDAATISVTSCSADEVANGINGGPLGNKHANGNGGTYAVVEIGGQCWMQENIDVDPAGAPSNFSPVPGSDIGDYAYYSNTYQAPGEGTLFQWSAAMNGSTVERAQGVCPDGWHIPSDCEWMFLENSLGMSVTDQEREGFGVWRGNVGSDLSDLTASGDNSSGFTALLAGYFSSSFVSRNAAAWFWTSTEGSSFEAASRLLSNTQSGVTRAVTNSNKLSGFSVRCLKD